MFWDDLIQNNLVRASPAEVEDMDPGIIFALKGLWNGRAKWSQELATNPKPKEVGKKSNASRTK